MGFFTSNSMGLEDMAHLVTYVIVSTIGFYSKSGAWPTDDFREKVVRTWLRTQGHKASHWKLTKLSLVGDNLARKALYEVPELIRVIPIAEGEDLEDIYEMLYEQSFKGLLFKGITK
jgi:hypothetical protein